MSSELKKASVGTAFLGGIFIFLLFGVIVLIWLRLGGKPEDFDQQRAVARAAKLDVLQKENHEKLTTYAWVNKAKGVVQLPIDRAMELVVADLKAKPVKASAVKLEVPYPAGLQAPPVAAAPAGSGTAAPGAPTAAASGTNATITAAPVSGTSAPAVPATIPASGTSAPATTTGTLSPAPAAPSPAVPSATTTPAP